LEAQPYDQMSDLSLMALCCYREARGEPADGKRGVCHVIQNRVNKPGWWGRDIRSVILKPYQFSSFNTDDPNTNIWPMDNNPAWTQCLSAASAILVGQDPDLTQGALYYHDSSITFPKAWGPEVGYVKTLTVGKLSFYRPL